MPLSAEAVKDGLRCGRAGCPCRKGPNVHCPAHEDQVPSFTVHEQAGKILLNCKSGCTQRAVVDALKERGLWATYEPSPLPRNHTSTATPQEKPVAEYEYKNSLGMVLAVKGRFEYGDGRKSFKWRLPSASAWTGLGGMTISSLPLWGVELLPAFPLEQPIFIVEGEKAALACREKGLFAVTHGGGSSTTDFGESLLALKGRQVVLWPDNDEAGRRYMARIHAVLRPLCKSIIIVQPPLPEKGDAFDYFASGGLAESLQGGLGPSGSALDYLAYDAIGVRIPSPIGSLSFVFSNLEKSNRELMCEVEVNCGDCGEPYSQRLNMLSGSQVTEMRRNLDSIFGREAGWTQLVNTAISKARRAFLEQDRALRLLDIPDPGPPRFLIPALLPEGVPTVWFGSGSSLKTYLALRAAISVAGGYPFLGMQVQKGAAMFVDYENQPGTFRFRCYRILAGMLFSEPPDLPLFHWPARGIPLADQIEAIKTKVSHEGITLVVIDSAASACGGRPEDADIALAYFMALQKLGLGVTTLTVAHCTKQNDEMHPFGSIFWTNTPRRTVNFSRTEDEDSDDIDVGVFFRKVNDGRKPSPMSFHVRFEGEGGPAIMTRQDIKEVPELQAKRGLAQQAWDVMSRPRSARDILSAMRDVDADTLTEKAVRSLRTTLGKHKDKFVRLEEGGKGRGDEARWARVAKPEPEQEGLPF